MEQRGGKSGVRMGICQCFIKVFLCAGATGSNDRNRDEIGDGAGQFEIITVFCAITVHTCKQNFTGTAAVGLHGPLYGINSHIDPSSVFVDIPAGTVRASFGINCDNNTLAAEFVGSVTDQGRILDSRRVDGNLIGSFAEKKTKVFHCADSATDGKTE